MAADCWRAAPDGSDGRQAGGLRPVDSGALGSAVPETRETLRHVRYERCGTRASHEKRKTLEDQEMTDP